MVQLDVVERNHLFSLESLDKGKFSEKGMWVNSGLTSTTFGLGLVVNPKCLCVIYFQAAISQTGHTRIQHYVENNGACVLVISFLNT